MRQGVTIGAPFMTLSFLALSVIPSLKITDRGPFVRGRIIDLTPAGAKALGFWGAGVTPVTLAVVGRG